MLCPLPSHRPTSFWRDCTINRWTMQAKGNITTASSIVSGRFARQKVLPDSTKVSGQTIYDWHRIRRWCCCFTMKQRPSETNTCWSNHGYRTTDRAGPVALYRLIEAALRKADKDSLSCEERLLSIDRERQALPTETLWREWVVTIFHSEK